MASPKHPPTSIILPPPAQPPPAPRPPASTSTDFPLRSIDRTSACFFAIQIFLMCMLAVYDTDLWFNIFCAYSALHIARMAWKIAHMWRRWIVETAEADEDVELAGQKEGGKAKGAGDRKMP